MVHTERRSAVIVEPDAKARMLLKQAATAANSFHSLYQVPLLTDAEYVIKSLEQCDVVFISGSLEHESITEFVKHMKNTVEGRDAAYTLVLKSRENTTEIVTKGVMEGLDGFLVEPFSVESFTEIVELSSRVRKERQAHREEAGLRFLVREIIDQLNLVSCFQAQGYAGAISKKGLQEMCSVLHTLNPESVELYYEIALEEFTKAGFPQELYQENLYSGGSQRVKKMTEQRMQVELQNRRKARSA